MKDRLRFTRQFRNNLDFLLCCVYEEQDEINEKEIISLLQADLSRPIDESKIADCIKMAINRYFTGKQNELHKIIKDNLTVKAANGNLTPKPIDKHSRTKDLFYDTVFDLYEMMDVSVKPLYKIFS